MSLRGSRSNRAKKKYPYGDTSATCVFLIYRYNIYSMNHELRNKHHHISFKLALSGIIYCFKTQPNFLVMTASTIVVLLASYFLKISYLELTIIIWTIVLVFAAEMINTAIESITDLITTEWRQEAKIAKDVSSGMTLLTIIGAVIVGLIIFVPKVLLYL